ncbi:hypothetical protein ANN_18813 [Periplaneta americana]|uniref:Reverse transcriptase domain-containing protein n=1 Tax=Periplaneta americana TaxID=6978 RepID=A0ABQ8SPR9_PERAM|nr:hypothetical protein ANN_18813 [Periplaneta americana]
MTIGGRRIKCIRFADDMALLAEEEMVLRDMLLKLNDSCGQYRMKINANKTKTMVIRRKIKKVYQYFLHSLQVPNSTQKCIKRCKTLNLYIITIDAVSKEHTSKTANSGEAICEILFITTTLRSCTRLQVILQECRSDQEVNEGIT